MKDVEIARRRNKSEATKKKILEAARELFSINGYNGVSVDDIVIKANVSKGSFYVHFDSKNSIIAFFISEYIKTVDPDYQRHLDSLPKDMKSYDVMLSLIEKIVDTLENVIGLQGMKTVYSLQLSDEVDMEIVKGYGRELYRIFASVLQRGADRGEFYLELPIEETTIHFVMSIRGLCYEWCIRPEFDFKNQALKHFRLLMSGIQNELK